MRRLEGFVAAIVLTCGAAFASDVLVVAQNAGPGVDFTSLQNAIDAAKDGDVVLVKTFTGAGATIAAKSLTLVVDSGNVAALSTPLTIHDVAAGSSVVVRGFNVAGPQNSAAVVVANCAGTVWIEGCKLTAPHGATVPSATLFIADSTDVVLLRTTANGANAAAGTGGIGAPALVATGLTTRVSAYEATLRGGDASSAPMSHGVEGGDAMRFEGLEAFVGGCSLTGGKGSGATIPFGGTGGAGGDGLVVPDVHVHRVWQWGNVLAGGAGGGGPPDGATGNSIVDPGGVVVATGKLPRSLTAQAVARAGQTLHVKVGIPGGGLVGPSSFVMMWVGPGPRFEVLAPTVGVEHVTRAGGAVGLGTLITTLDLDLPVPPLPTFVGQGVVCFAQALVIKQSTLTLTSPTAFVLLDPAL